MRTKMRTETRTRNQIETLSADAEARRLATCFPVERSVPIDDLESAGHGLAVFAKRQVN